MAEFINGIKDKYRNGGILWKLLIINIGIFLSLRITAVVVTLCGFSFDSFLYWIGMSADVHLFLWRPWTIITYMFVQYDFSHILFNMLWLYWFAKLFLHFFNPKQMFALYIYGGLGGALLYMAAYNLFPYFSDSVHNSLMIGASASILAIVVATAVYEPKYPVNLIIFGSIPLMWIAGGTIIIDFISIIESNAGGHIAHLGGAIVGFLFASSYKKGVDITTPFNNILDRLATPRQHNSQRERKPRFETSGTHRNTQPNASRQQDNQSETELNVILDKIRRSGYSSLTDAERHKLFSITTPKDDK